MATTSSGAGTLKTLLIMHKAMLAGQLIFAAVAFYLVYSKSFPFQNLQELDRILQVVALVCSVGGFYTGLLLFKKRLIAAREIQPDSKGKLAVYRQACILQWSLIEGPCLFVIICFLLTHNYAFLALAGVLILIFTMMAPSKMKIAFQLQISEEEVNEL